MKRPEWRGGVHTIPTSDPSSQLDESMPLLTNVGENWPIDRRLSPLKNPDESRTYQVFSESWGPYHGP